MIVALELFHILITPSVSRRVFSKAREKRLLIFDVDVVVVIANLEKPEVRDIDETVSNLSLPESHPRNPQESSTNHFEPEAVSISGLPASDSST